VESNSAAISPASDTLGKVALYDDSYACLRISRVEGNLAEKLRAAYDGLARTNTAKIKRRHPGFAFCRRERLRSGGGGGGLLSELRPTVVGVGTGSARATKKTNAIHRARGHPGQFPNAGAAEALAAALREADIGLILGGTTAGQANISRNLRWPTAKNCASPPLKSSWAMEPRWPKG